MLLRRSRLAARAARTFSSYTNVLRDRSNVLRLRLECLAARVAAVFPMLQCV